MTETKVSRPFILAILLPFFLCIFLVLGTVAYVSWRFSGEVEKRMVLPGLIERPSSAADFKNKTRSSEILLKTIGADLIKDQDGRIERVELIHTSVANIDAILRHLSNLFGLKSLIIIELGFTGRGLQHLAGLPHIEEIVVHSKAFAKEGFQALGTLKTLKYLELHGDQLHRVDEADAALSYIGDLPALKTLVLTDTIVTDQSLKHLKTLDDLESLVIVGPNVKGPGLVHLSGLDNLVNLTVNRISEEILQNLQYLPHLRSLETAGHIGWTRHPPAGAYVHLQDLNRLESLDLSRAAATDEVLAHIQYIHNLKALDLHNARISDIGLAYLGQLYNLRELKLGWNTTGEEGITDVGLRHLRSLTFLEVLSLGGRDKLSNAGLKHLTSLKNLRSLTFYWQGQITDEGMVHLAELPKLQFLKLGHMSISNRGIAHLAGLNDLEYVDIGNTRATLCGLLRLQKINNIVDALRATKAPFELDEEGNIISLRLISIKLTSGCLERIKELRELRSLLLTGTGITDADLADLAHLSKLESLDLCCEVCGVGLSALAKLDHLKKLELSKKAIKLADLESIAKLRNLEDLKLESRTIEQGALRALGVLENLKTLDIRNVPANDDDFEFLKETLSPEVKIKYY